VDGDKKTAKIHHDEAIHGPNTICIYTDGSGINSHVRAAAYSPTTSTTRQRYLGTELEYNVYTAEVAAIELAADIVQENRDTFNQCIIYYDS
jgi:hypothetical protein